MTTNGQYTTFTYQHQQYANLSSPYGHITFGHRTCHLCYSTKSATPLFSHKW